MKRFALITTIMLATVCFAHEGRAQGVSFAPLFVSASPGGSVFPLSDGQLLEVGQVYDMEAIPDPGFVFSSWNPVHVFTFTEYSIDANGDPNPPVTSINFSPVPEFTLQPTLEFTMQPAAVLVNIPGVSTVTEAFGWQADFVPVPEPSSLAVIVCGLAASLFLMPRVGRSKRVLDCAGRAERRWRF
jgi:hypothetical protein